jgi:hypothetical protein
MGEVKFVSIVNERVETVSRLSVVILVGIAGLVSCAAGPPAIRVCVSNGKCGTGTTVAETPYLLTATHVIAEVKKGSKVLVQANPGLPIENTIVLAGSRIDPAPDGDAALIHVPVIDDQNYPLCSAVDGESVTMHSLNGQKKGIVVKQYGDLVVTTIKAKKGNSGSAVVSDNRQCVIGLLIMLAYETDEHGNMTKQRGTILVGSGVLKRLIERSKENGNPR